MSATSTGKLELKQVMGFKECISIAIGQTIGSGVMAMTGTAIGMTGSGVMIAYLLSALLNIIMNIPLAVMGSTVPSTGGEYKYACRLLGEKWGLFYIFLYLAYNLTLSLYAIAFADYLSSLFPGIPLKLVGFLFMTFFFVVNLFGIKQAATAENIMVVALIAALGIFVFYGIPQVDMSAFQMQKLMPNGWRGMITAAGLLTFATGGSASIAFMGGEIKNPGKTIPICMISGTLIVSLLYAGIGLVAGGVLPMDQVANQNLAVVASAILPRPLFVFFILFGALGAIATTLNSTFMWVTKPMLAACHDFGELGWLPRKLGAVNEKYKTPHNLLIMFYLIGIIPVLFSISLATISKLGTGLMLLMAALPLASSAFLYKRYPEACKKSFFILKPGVLNTFAVLSAGLALIQVFMLVSDLTPLVITITVVYVACAFLLANYLDKKHHIPLYSGDYDTDFNN